MMNCTNLIHSFAKTLLITLLCTFGVGEMEASLYIVGDEALTGHDWQAGEWGDRKADASVTFYAVSAGDHYFRVAADGAKFDTDYNVSTNTDVCGTLSGTVSGGTASDKSVKITLSEISDVTFTRQGETWTYDVHGNASCYFIKYDWNGTGTWAYSGMMVSNLDGTYSVSGPYHGLSYNHARRGSDGGAGSDYHEDGATIVGDTPSDGETCVFTLNPDDDYSLTIRKANTVAKPNYIYFDNIDANWTDTYLYFVIGRPEYSKMYRITQVSNTKLWRVANTADDWSDGSYYAIAGRSTAWDNETGWGMSALTGWNRYSAPYTDAFNMTTNSYYMVEKEDGANGGAITITDKGKSYSMLNFTNLWFQYNVDGSNMSSGKTPAQVSMASYRFTTNNFTTGANATKTITANSNSAYADSVMNCAYRGTTTLTMSNLRDGYMFKGWQDGTTLHEDNPYTFYPNAATTITAKFESKWCVKGDMNSWGESDLITHMEQDDSGHDIGYVEITLDGNTTYDFKIYDRLNDAWYSCSNSSAKTDLTLSDNGDAKTCTTGGSEKDMTLHTAAPGTYRFTWNTYSKKLTITYPTSYLVTYNGNGNTGGTAPTGVYYASNATVTVADEPDGWAKSAYTFGGWNTADDGSGSNYTAGSGQFTITDDTPLYAKWTQTVTLHDNNGAAHNGSTTATWNAAGPFSITAPQKTGYHVEGYYAEEGCTNKVMTNAGALVNYSGYVESGKWVHAAATVLYTKWTEDMHTVTVSAGAGGSVDETSVSAGGVTASTTIKASPNPGYYFTGWTIPDGVTVASGDGTNAITINATAGDLTITAKFALRWSVAGTFPGATVWDVDAHMLTNIGTNASGDDTCSYSFTTFEDNHTYRFKIVDHVLVNGKMSWYGRNSSDPFEMNYNTAMPWTLGAGGDTVCIINTAAAGTYKFEWNITHHKLTVTYPTSYQITMAMDPNTGGGAISPAEGTFWVGTDAFDIVATPNYSHYFAGWTSSNGGSFDDDAAESTKFTASADATVTANFALRYAFINGKFQVYDDSDRKTRTMVGTAGGAGDYNSRSIPMTYDETYHRFYCQTYSTPDELKEISSGDGAYFSIQTSTSSSSWVDRKQYGAIDWKDGGINALSASGTPLTTILNTRTFNFSGSEDGYVIIYFDGSQVWYELECALSYNGNTGTGSGPARKFYDYGVAQTAADADTYTLSGYDFSHWNTKADNSGTTYAAGASIPMTAAEDTLYAQWKFVIYRTGDKQTDSQRETYAGGAKIGWPIEYRMKVSTLDQWYSLYLPFDVDAVQVIEDGIYYDIVPYYRPTVGGTYYLGHYVIRTPAKTSDFPIKDFDDWRDPDNYDVLPSKNTPYIILWHDSYFLNKYISFFGHTDETIPTAMTPGDRPDKDSVVNVYGNNAMVSGSVEDGYTLEADYGQGAWLREDEIGASRTVQPFECYLRANAVTTPIFKAVRRQDVTTDIPMTDDPSPRTDKFLINGQVVIIRDNKMYNILGMEIQ